MIRFGIETLNLKFGFTFPLDFISQIPFPLFVLVIFSILFFVEIRKILDKLIMDIEHKSNMEEIK